MVNNKIDEINILTSKLVSLEGREDERQEMKAKNTELRK